VKEGEVNITLLNDLIYSLNLSVQKKKLVEIEGENNLSSHSGNSDKKAKYWWQNIDR